MDRVLADSMEFRGQWMWRQLFSSASLSLVQIWGKDQSSESVAGSGRIRQGVYFYEDAENKK